MTGKRFAILGFAFKADTNDTREAQSIRIVSYLLEFGAQLSIQGPKAAEAQISHDLQLESAFTAYGLSGTGSLVQATSIEAAVQGADAVLILTEWQNYRELNWSDPAALIRRPASVFDARAVVDPVAINVAGFRLWRICDGKG